MKFPEQSAIKYPSLTPLVSRWMKEIWINGDQIRSIFEEYGSPVNIHNGEPFKNNIEEYRQVFNQHSLKHTICFARKANKCRFFPKEANRLGGGVDVASYRELEQCLDLGCNPDELVVTAAVKKEPLIELAISNDVLLILDNEDECCKVNRMASRHQKKIEVGIRLSGFYVNGQKLYSRFGFDIDHAAEFILNRLGEQNELDSIQFSGFHFHLDGYSIHERASALEQTIDQADILKRHDITTSFIDIGGGILTNYLSSKTEWENFQKELQKAVKGKRDPITFRNDGLGYKLSDGKLWGEMNVYPYFNEISKGTFLDRILSHTTEKGKTVASLLREKDIEIRIEPGRSLLDQTGITLARVVHRKKDSNGNWLIGLEMNRSQLYSSSTDFLLDPVYIPMSDSLQKSQDVPVYLVGGYCLESDIILKRKIVLPTLPNIGDVICFPNTAGYMMHFYETHSHLFELSTNLIAVRNSKEFIRDEEIK